MNKDPSKSIKKAKIGIFTKPIDDGMSGSGIHLYNLVNNILKVNNKFDIVLIHHHKNNNKIYKKTAELIIPINPVIETLKIVREHFDLLHYSPLTILSPVWLKNSKKIATIHGGGGSQLLLPHLYGKLRLFHSNMIRPYLARKMDYIFTVSETSKKLIVKNYHVDEKKIEITYNAVDDDFKIDKNNLIEIKRRFGIDSPFIFHLSRYSERKNPWTLLKSFKILREKKLNIKLVIGGIGWNNKEIVKYCKENGIAKDIIITGFISREDIIKLLNLAEVFVFPSLFEGFGIPNLEAMACGCPVITSNAFAIPEIVGDAAIILKNNKDPIELSDKIIQLLEDKKLRDELIDKGLKRVKLYSWEKSAKEVLRIYEKCLND